MEPKVEALLQEYETLRSEIELAIRNQVRILGYGGTVLGVFAGLGIIQPSVLVVVALPFIAFFFSILWSIEQTRMMRAGDYISTIETRLNEEHLEEPVLLWENWLRFRADRQPEYDIYFIHYWLQYIVIAVFMLTEIVGIVTIWSWQPTSLGLALQIALTALYLTFVGVMYFVLRRIVTHKSIEESFGRLREGLD